MGVGSLHSPREYDGRLPPDVGYYLNLVIPRKEEPRKKIGSQVRLLHGRILQIRWSIYMQSNPRIVVKLLVISVKTLVNLLVKLTKLGWGAMGGHTPSTSLSQTVCRPDSGRPPGLGSMVRPPRDSWDLWDFGDLGREINGYPFTTFGFPDFLGRTRF